MAAGGIDLRPGGLLCMGRDPPNLQGRSPTMTHTGLMLVATPRWAEFILAVSAMHVRGYCH